MSTEIAPGPFKTGDGVYLKSGGPLMTVLDVGATTGMVWCRWMVEEKHANSSTSSEPVFKEGFFPAGALRPHQ